MQPPKPTYSISLEYVSPETAKEWLTRLGKNRVLSLANVKHLSETMTAGRWVHEAPQLIIFDTDGFVRDGQNRLHAIARANVGIWAIIAREMQPEAFAVLDTGRRRSAADALHIDREIKYATITASACRYAQNYIEGAGLRSRRDNDEIVAFFDANRGIADMAGRCYRVNKVFGPSPFAAVMHLASQTRSLHGKITKFIDGIADPSSVALTAGDPRTVLRGWASRQMTQKGQVIRPEPLMMATSRAWNAFAADKTIGLADLRSTKMPHRDTMPITGWKPDGFVGGEGVRLTRKAA